MARLTTPKPDLILVNQGVEVRLSRDYRELELEAMQRLDSLLTPYPKARRFLDVLVQDPEVRANWDMADYLVVTKMGFSDHGEVHHKVVAAAAASLLQLLVESEIEPDVVKSGAGDRDDAFLVTITAALLHDIGNQIHRVAHHNLGLILALPLLDRLLAEIYPEAEQRYELRGFILHAIHTHDIDVPPLTLEAAIVAVADACDMTKGRSRYAFDLGAINIHSVGGLSIERVTIAQGASKPINIRVELSNSAGIFPVEEYLVPKVNAGELAPYVEVVVSTSPVESHSDQRILYTVEMQGKRFVAQAPQTADPSAPVEITSAAPTENGAH